MALAKKAEMGIVGFNYQQERSFDVLEAAASNEGSAQSGLMGAGLGMGLGIGAGVPMGNTMAGISQHLNVTPAQDPGASQKNLSEFDRKVEALSKLADLREKGILSQEEFDQEKQKILSL